MKSLSRGAANGARNGARHVADGNTAKPAQEAIRESAEGSTSQAMPDALSAHLASISAERHTIGDQKDAQNGGN